MEALERLYFVFRLPARSFDPEVRGVSTGVVQGVALVA